MRSCEYWEEKIALAAGADLDDGDCAALEDHLAACPACAALLADLRASVGLLQDLHNEPLEEAHLAAVRARVMAAVDAPRRWPWAAAVVFACGAVLALAAVWFRPRPVPELPVLAVGAPRAGSDRSLTVAAPKGAPLRAATARARSRVRTHAQVTPERLPASSEPVVVKLFTDDPNVVIYWIGDTQ